MAAVRTVFATISIVVASRSTAIPVVIVYEIRGSFSSMFVVPCVCIDMHVTHFCGFVRKGVHVSLLISNFTLVLNIAVTNHLYMPHFCTTALSII